MFNNKKAEDMTKEELIEKVRYLESKHVWGLQVADFAMTFYEFDEEFSEEEVFSKEELSDIELLESVHQKLRDENFHIYDWSDYIVQHEYSPELMKMFRTAQHRGF